MVETDIKIGPIRPVSGPLAKTGGAAISSNSGSGPVDVRLRQSEQDIRALQDQVLALSQLLDQLISVPMLIASGPNNQSGVVPAPGTTVGTAKFLREDATWIAVSATGLTGILPVPHGGTGTATGSITGTGDLIFHPGADSTTGFQVQNDADVAVLTVDTGNGFVDIGVQNGPITAVIAGRRYLTIKGVSGAAVLELATADADAGGLLTGQVTYTDPNITGLDKRIAIVSGLTDGATANNRGGAMVFTVKTDGGALHEAARFNNLGYLLIGTAATGASILRVANLPTSAAGLSTDDIWCDTGAGNVLKRV